jgi:chemotaxis protein CheX
MDNDHLVDIIRDATTDVLATMFNMEVTQETAYVEHSAAPCTEGVLAFVGLAGVWAGTGAIGCSAPLACYLCSQMLMNEYSAMNDEVLDAVAELTNMIIGNVKTRLEEELGPMGLSIPTVIYGRNFTSRSIGNADWTVVPFRHGEERLLIQVCLVPQGEGRRPRIAVAESIAVNS